MKIKSSVIQKKKRNRYSIKISMTIFAQQAKVGSEISLVLGQYGISVSKFCTEFNNKSAYLSPEIPLLVDIFLFDNRDFKFMIRGVNLAKLVRRFVGDKLEVTCKEVFYISFLYFTIMERFFVDVYYSDIFLQEITKRVCSVLWSFNRVQVV